MISSNGMRDVGLYCALGAVVVLWPAAAAPSQASCRGPMTRVVLDHLPMTDPVAQVIAVEATGHLQVARYSSARGEVIAVQVGELDRPAKAALDRALSRPAVCATGTPDNWTGDGLRSGDQFHLTVTHDAVVRSLVGLVVQAPAEVAAAVKQLLELGAGARSVPLVGAFVRALPMPAARLQRLRQRGFVVIEPAALPVADADVVRQATLRPREFFALSPAQWTSLATLSKGKPGTQGAASRSLYLSADTAAFEVQLFGKGN